MKTKLILVIIVFSTLLKGQDCVLIHGWLNSGNVWNSTGVKSILQNEYYFTRILQPSLDGTNSAYQQSLNLKNYLISNSVSNSLAISYSMGGMNTRYHLKRQFELGQSSRISYHFSIGSPHIGAMLANNSAAAVQRIIVTCAAALKPNGYLSETTSGINIHYSLLESAYYAAVLISSEYFYQLIFNSGGPALNDLKMGSNADLYINHPNTNYENNIVRVGITGVEDYPQVYRTAASGVGWTESQMLNIVDYVKAYKFLILISDFIRWAEYPTPQNLDYLEESLGTLSIFLEFPKSWNLLVAGSTTGESDGIVQKSSQIYPNHNLQLYANGANHIEELNNIEVLNRLRFALSQYGFGPQLPPIISHFTQSPNPICKGGSGTVTAYLSQGNPPPTYTWEKLSYPPGFNLLNTTGNPCYVVYNNTGLLAPDDYTDAVVRCTVTVAGGGGSDIKNYVVKLVNECPSCPTLAFNVGGEMTDDNPLLITSLSNPGVDVTDYYLVQNEVTPVGNKINLRIHEPQTEHTWLDYTELIVTRVRSDELVAVNDEGEIINYKEATAPVTVILNGETDITEILAAMDSVDVALTAGDIVTVIRNSQSPEDDGDGDVVLGGEVPIKDQESITLRVAKQKNDNENIESSNGDDPPIGGLFFRPKRSVIAKSLRNVPPGNLEIEINKDLVLDYLAVVRNIRTARSRTLNLLGAVHNQQGDVKNLLSTLDQNYAEILPGESIDFNFQFVNLPTERIAYIIKTVGRYETDSTAALNKLAGTGDEELIPIENKLFDNYPNPFNPATQIKYSVKVDGLVMLKVYDILGKEVASLVNEEQQAGTYTVTFDAGNLASGIYFYTISANEFQKTKKMLLIK